MSLDARFYSEKAEYETGDDVIVVLSVTNRDQTPVTVFLPNGRADGVKVTVVEGTGQRETPTAGVHDGGIVAGTEVLPGQTADRRYRLHEWFTLERSGTFSLRCSALVEYRINRNGEQRGHLDIESVVQFAVESAEHHSNPG